MMFSMALALSVLACKDKGSDCELEDFEGTPFFSSEGATGGLSGEVSWPNSRADGMLMEFGFESADGSLYVGAIGDNIFDPPATCGTSMFFNITGVDPGDYSVVVKIQESFMESSDTGEQSYVAEGASDVVTVSDSVVEDINVSLSLVP